MPATRTAPATHAGVFVAAEDIPEFEAFQQALTIEFDARSEFEHQCVRTVIHSLWTIRRTRIVESRMQERAVRENIVDPLLDVEWALQLKGVLNLRRQAERCD